MTTYSFKFIVLVIAFALVAFVNTARASEVTGNLNTSITTTATSTISGTVTSPTTPTDVAPQTLTISAGLSSNRGVAVALRGDINRDGKIDIADYVMLMTNWTSVSAGNIADLTNDGKVDILDLVIMMANWTK